MSDTNHIQVITYADQELTRGVSDLITARLDVNKLKEKLRAFLASLHAIVDWDQYEKNGFQLQEIEFSVELSAEGDFKLLGVGTSTSTTGAIKFVLKKKDNMASN